MSGYAGNAFVHRAGHPSDIVFLPKPFTAGGLLARCGRLSTDETTSRRLRGSARNVTCNLDFSRTITYTWYGFGEVVRLFSQPTRTWYQPGPVT